MKTLITFIIMSILYAPLPAYGEDSLSQREIDCLSKNVYFEARGEDEVSKISVINVTMNRVESEEFPDSICEVVHQGVKDDSGNPILYGCQFTWFCDGKSDLIRNQEVYDEIIELVEEASDLRDRTKGALFYHNVTSHPDWASHMTRTTRIGDHIFYKL